MTNLPALKLGHYLTTFGQNVTPSMSTTSGENRGMTDEMHSELLAVIAMAQETNGLANSLQVPVDDCFEAGR